MTLENIEHNNLQDFYFELVQTLARVIDAKIYTYDHADRARHCAKLIAENAFAAAYSQTCGICCAYARYHEGIEEHTKNREVHLKKSGSLKASYNR